MKKKVIPNLKKWDLNLIVLFDRLLKITCGNNTYM